MKATTQNLEVITINNFQYVINPILSIGIGDIGIYKNTVGKISGLPVDLPEMVEFEGENIDISSFKPILFSNDPSLKLPKG